MAGRQLILGNIAGGNLYFHLGLDKCNERYCFIIDIYESKLDINGTNCGKAQEAA